MSDPNPDEPLQEKLDAIKAGFEKRAPQEALDIMHRATADLIESGLHQRAAGAGTEFPDFTLADANGNQIESSTLFGDRPVIVNFFRGHW